MIYVIHFSRPYKHATHYIGYTSSDSEHDRIAEELSGGSRAAKLMQVVVAAGIQVELGGIIQGDRKRERSMKKRKAACPSRGIRTICALCRYLIRERESGNSN